MFINAGVNVSKAQPLCARCVILEDLLRRLPGGQVIITSVKDDHSGLVRDDNTISVVSRIGELRATKATIDDFGIGKILCQIFPHADGRTADKHDCAFCRRVLTICLFEFLDVGFPAVRGSGSLLRRDRGGANYQAAKFYQQSASLHHFSSSIEASLLCSPGASYSISQPQRPCLCRRM